MEYSSLREIMAMVKELEENKEFEAAADLLLKATENSKFQWDLEIYSKLGSISIKAVNANLTALIKKFEWFLKHSRNSRRPENKYLVIGILNSLGMLYQKRNFQGNVRSYISPKKEIDKSDLEKSIDRINEAIMLNPNDYSYRMLSYSYQLQGNFFGAYMALEDGIKNVSSEIQRKSLVKLKEELAEQFEHAKLINEIEYKITQDLDDVFNTVRDKMREKYEEIYREIIHQESRWKSLEKERLDGIIKGEDYRIERNAIVKAIIKLLYELKRPQYKSS